jgi:hypothetical protein
VRSGVFGRDLGIVDDAQIVDLHATKRLAEIGEPPGVRITVTDPAAGGIS